MFNWLKENMRNFYRFFITKNVFTEPKILFRHKPNQKELNIIINFKRLKTA